MDFVMQGVPRLRVADKRATEPQTSAGPSALCTLVDLPHVHAFFIIFSDILYNVMWQLGLFLRFEFSPEIDGLSQGLYICVENTAPGLVIGYSFVSTHSIRESRMGDTILVIIYSYGVCVFEWYVLILGDVITCAK